MNAQVQGGLDQIFGVTKEGLNGVMGEVITAALALIGISIILIAYYWIRSALSISYDEETGILTIDRVDSEVESDRVLNIEREDKEWAEMKEWYRMKGRGL